LRPHGDWVMSFNDVKKGANSGFVSTLGQNLAQFPFLHFRRTSVAIHKISTQELGNKGLS
jgi:hypothetical protein